MLHPPPSFLLKARLGFFETRGNVLKVIDSSKFMASKSPSSNSLPNSKVENLGCFCSTLEFMVCAYVVDIVSDPINQQCLPTIQPLGATETPPGSFCRDDLLLEEKNKAFGIKNQALRQTCVYIYIYNTSYDVYTLYTLFFVVKHYI